jgi:ribosomal protein L37AE/L43A
MPSRQNWYDDYWKNLDKKTERKLRTTCPQCGSANTYYNKLFGTWRCQNCEHSFVVTGVGGKPWWRRLLRL